MDLNLFPLVILVIEKIAFKNIIFLFLPFPSKSYNKVKYLTLPTIIN
jgi:hypothetical protein